MALETLKNVKKIGGFTIVDTDDRDKHRLSCSNPISVCHIENLISFKIQNGPIKENGVNGCQVDTIIEAAKLIIEGLNKNFPCRENAMVITKLDEALMWSNKRKADREKRGVEGYNKK